MCWKNFQNLRTNRSNTLRTMVPNFWTSIYVQFLRLYWFWCLSVNISFMIIGVMPWYMAMAKALRFLSRIETELSISSNSSKEDFLSLYMKRRHLSWSLFILLYFVGLWHIQTNWQQLYWDMKNAFNNNLFLFKSIYGVILAKAFNLRPAFLQMSLMWASKVSFESNLTHNSFSHRLLFTFYLVFNSYVNFVIFTSSKMTFVWISFHLIIIKLLEKCQRCIL